MRTLPLLVIMAVVGLSARAHAAGWVSSGPLTPPDRTAVDAHVALTPSGERVVAWIQFDATGQQPENISVRVAPPGGDFGPDADIPRRAVRRPPARHRRRRHDRAGVDGRSAHAAHRAPRARRDELRR